MQRVHDAPIYFITRAVIELRNDIEEIEHFTCIRVCVLYKFLSLLHPKTLYAPSGRTKRLCTVSRRRIVPTMIILFGCPS